MSRLRVSDGRIAAWANCLDSASKGPLNRSVNSAIFSWRVLFRVHRLFNFSLVKDIDGSASAHHCQFDAGPDKKLIGAHFASTKRLLSAAISFARQS